MPFVPRVDSMDFVPDAAAAAAPSLGAAAKPFVPGGAAVNAAVFVPGGAAAAANKTSVVDAPEFVPGAGVVAEEEEEEDEEVMLPEMGDLEALGFGVRACARVCAALCMCPPLCVCVWCWGVGGASVQTSRVEERVRGVIHSILVGQRETRS